MNQFDKTGVGVCAMIRGPCNTKSNVNGKCLSSKTNTP
jgi:hypothetical protein